MNNISRITIRFGFGVGVLWQKASSPNARFEEIDVAAKEETNEAVKFAEESPFPQENEILNDVYWEVDHQTDAAKQGRYFFNS